MSSRRGVGSRLQRVGATGFVVAALFCLVAASASATGEADAYSGGIISIVEIRDAMGTTLTSLPDGLDIVPGTVGPDEGPDDPESGTGVVVFGGAAAATGMGLTTQVDISSDTNATASPAGAADGLETASGFIQFLNNSGQAVEIDVRFAWGLGASATVTDAALETAEVTLSAVEFQDATGGSPTSPCNTPGLLVDEDLTAGPAPPDDTPAGMAGIYDTTVLLPNGETCSYVALVQTAARAGAEAEMIPSLPALATLLLGLALVAMAYRWLHGRHLQREA